MNRKILIEKLTKLSCEKIDYSTFKRVLKVLILSCQMREKELLKMLTQLLYDIKQVESLEIEINQKDISDIEREIEKLKKK